MRQSLSFLQLWWRSRLPLLALLLHLVFLFGCAVEGSEGVALTILWGGEHHYGPGTRFPGDLLLLDGHVTLEAGAELTGSLYMLDGTLESQGAIGGDALLLGGAARLGSQARIAGDLDHNQDVTLAVAPGVVLGAQTTHQGTLLPDLLAQPPRLRPDVILRTWFGYLLLALLAALLARWHAPLLANSAAAITEHPLLSGAVGLLAGLVAPALLVLMAFTVVLLPVTTLGILLFLLLAGYAQTALGLAAGQRLVPYTRWSPGRSTFAGTLLVLLTLWLLRLVPLIGDLVGVLVVVVAVGGVLLTRFGTTPYHAPLPPLAEVDLDSYRRPRLADEEQK